MRYKELLAEMPLASYDLHGDFSQQGSFDVKDRKLVSSAKHPERLERLLRAGKTLLCVHVANITRDMLYRLGFDTADNTDGDNYDLRMLDDIGGQLKLRGEFSPADLLNRFGLKIQPKADAISFVVLGNALGGDSLSAWMLIHRLTHMVEDASQDATHAERAGRTVRVSPALRTAMIGFQRYVNTEIRQDRLSKLVTMKSAPNNSELDNEILTQFLVKGRVTLRIDADPEAQQIEDQLNQLCEQIQSHMLGRIFAAF